LRLEGNLRVTATDTLMASILPPALAAFSRAHPGITLEVSTANVIANLTKRDANVAIRAAGSPSETLVGRKISDIAWAIYAPLNYKAGAADGLPAERWIGPDDSLAGTSYAKWLRERLPEAMIAARADSFVTIRDLIAEGVGLAALPCYLGDRSSRLRRLAPGPFLKLQMSFGY
jgi:DNA-binding transcriptional LysR family regulator